jgi:prepilin-type N-terminal cleavage/methylation domain-containing protein
VRAVVAARRTGRFQGAKPMRLSVSLPTASDGKRPGFTLIELMVVIFIIAILVSLTMSAAIKVLGVQESINSKLTVEKVNDAMHDQWNKTLQQGIKNSRSAATLDQNAYFAISALAGTQQNQIEDAKRFQAIYVAYYMKQQFPHSFAEVLLCNQYADPRYKAQYYNPLGPDQGFVRQLTNLGVTPNDPPLAGESSALLLMALEKAIGGPGRLTDTLGSASVKNQSFPTAGTPIDVRVLKDAWDSPVEFFRWTTNPDVDALAPASKSLIRNPLDPEGKLIDPNWVNDSYTVQQLFPPTSNRVLFETSCYPVTNPVGNVKNPYAYYYVPVVVSAGANKVLGLDLQTMLPLPTATANDLADNIYGYQVKKE